MLQLGRWVELPYFRFLRGRVNNPWLNGAYTVFWTSLAMYLASSLLQLGRKATAAVCGVFYPLTRWCKANEGFRWPWPHVKSEKKRIKELRKEQEQQKKK